MAFEFRIFALPFIIGAVISLLLALVILQRPNAKGGVALALLMLECSVWAGANFVRWSLVDPADQVFWLELSHAIFVPAPLTFLVFVTQLTRTDRWLTQANLLVLASEPVATMLLIATNSSHFLFYASFQPATVNGFPQMGWQGGPWYWVNTACSYAFILASAIILLRALLRAGPYGRVQLGIVLLGCLVPWALNIYTLIFPAAARQLEITPLAATASGLIFAYALFRPGLLDIVPIARSLLFEKLGDGVLVLDTNGRILDVNLAGQRIAHIGNDSFGKNIWEAVPQWRDFGEAEDGGLAERHFELQGRQDPSHFYDVTVIPLLDRRGHQDGRLISLRDITERKLAETELHKMNARLQRQVHKISALHAELQEQAIRDALTGLYNRRYLDDTLQRELSRSRRAGYAIGVIMMDIDNFKEVNDTYGHKAGDRVLKALSEIIHLHIRLGDIPCRFGGEEFVIVLPETSLQTAAERAEEIRLHFYSAKFFKGAHPVIPALSIGISAFPAHGETADAILQAADLAMYSAKSRGGNEVVSYKVRKKIKRPAASKRTSR